MEKTIIFQNLKCWKTSRKLLMTVHSVSTSEKLADAFFLKNQLKRKAILSMSPIAEGFDRTSSEEFISNLNCSQRSVAELKCMLSLLADQNYFVTERTHELVRQIANDTCNHTIELITYLQRNK